MTWELAASWNKILSRPTSTKEGVLETLKNEKKIAETILNGNNNR